MDSRADSERRRDELRRGRAMGLSGSGKSNGEAGTHTPHPGEGGFHAHGIIRSNLNLFTVKSPEGRDLAHYPRAIIDSSPPHLSEVFPLASRRKSPFPFPRKFT